MTAGDDGVERATIRPLQPDDETMLAEFLVTNAVPEVEGHFHPFPLTRDTASALVSEPRNDRFYVAVVDGRIVALTMLRGWDDGYDVPSFGVVVDRNWHGRGLGARMTDFALDEARKLACPAVRLSVYASNDVAHAMYARRGFRETERTAIERAGVPDERIVMIKELVG